MKPTRSTPIRGSLGCACANLRRVTRAVTQLYDDALRPRGLRITQFTLLQVLARRGAVTQGTLATFLAVDSTTLSRNLKPLETAGLIRGFRGADRRERYLELAPAGRRALERAAPAWEVVQRQLRERLGKPTWLALEQLTTSAVAAAARG